MYDDVWSLHLVTLQWTRLAVKLPVALFFHSMAVTPVQTADFRPRIDRYIFVSVSCLGWMLVYIRRLHNPGGNQSVSVHVVTNLLTLRTPQVR